MNIPYFWPPDLTDELRTNIVCYNESNNHNGLSPCGTPETLKRWDDYLVYAWRYRSLDGQVVYGLTKYAGLQFRMESAHEFKKVVGNVTAAMALVDLSSFHRENRWNPFILIGMHTLLSIATLTSIKTQSTNPSLISLTMGRFTFDVWALVIACWLLFGLIWCKSRAFDGGGGFGSSIYRSLWKIWSVFMGQDCRYSTTEDRPQKGHLAWLLGGWIYLGFLILAVINSSVLAELLDTKLLIIDSPYELLETLKRDPGAYRLMNDLALSGYHTSKSEEIKTFLAKEGKNCIDPLCELSDYYEKDMEFYKRHVPGRGLQRVFEKFAEYAEVFASTYPDAIAKALFVKLRPKYPLLHVSSESARPLASVVWASKHIHQSLILKRKLCRFYRHHFESGIFWISFQRITVRDLESTASLAETKQMIMQKTQKVRLEALSRVFFQTLIIHLVALVALLMEFPIRKLQRRRRATKIQRLFHIRKPPLVKRRRSL